MINCKKLIFLNCYLKQKFIWKKNVFLEKVVGKKNFFLKIFFHVCRLKVPAHKCPVRKRSRLKVVDRNGTARSILKYCVWSLQLPVCQLQKQGFISTPLCFHILIITFLKLALKDNTTHATVHPTFSTLACQKRPQSLVNIFLTTV